MRGSRWQTWTRNVVHDPRATAGDLPSHETRLLGLQRDARELGVGVTNSVESFAASRIHLDPCPLGGHNLSDVAETPQGPKASAVNLVNWDLRRGHNGLEGLDLILGHLRHGFLLCEKRTIDLFGCFVKFLEVSVKAIFPEIVEAGRVTSTEWGTSHGDTFGFFFVKHPRTRRTFKIMVGDDDGWDHVSVSLPKRCPTWDEMCWVKDLFFAPEERVVQYHPPQSEYVQNHPHCLHLWRPQTQEIPSPPEYMVGIKQLGELTVDTQPRIG